MRVGNWKLTIDPVALAALGFTIWMAVTGRVDPWLVVLVWAPWASSEWRK